MGAVMTVRRRRGVALGLAALTAVVTAGAAVPVAAAGWPARAVPWRQAGTGWSVVEYSAASAPGTVSPSPGPTMFYLVSPQGRKYRFYTTPAAAAYPLLTLDDWSADRQRILVERATGPAQRTVFEQISLATGTVVSRSRPVLDVLGGRYTRPAGRSLLASGYAARSRGIFRYDLAGHLQRVLARGQFENGPVDSPGGAFVVAGTRAGLDQVSNAGPVTRRIRVPAPVVSCQPARWWTASTVLASCFGRPPHSTSRLWLFPFGGGQPAALTPALGSHGLFLGYFGAWRLDGRLYLQADNAHDMLSIVRQFRGGARRTVRIPGPAGISPQIITAFGRRLLLQSGTDTGDSGTLCWFNPVTGSVRFIIRTPSAYGVTGAIAFGYRND